MFQFFEVVFVSSITSYGIIDLGNDTLLDADELVEVVESTEKCRDYLSHEINPQFSKFDELIKFFNSIRCVTVNNDEWKLTKCLKSRLYILIFYE